jgi:tetratricopeptide (TPR) repeat protein
LKPHDKEAAQNEGVFYNDLARSLGTSDPERANDYARKHLALIPALMKQFPGDDDIVDEAAFAHAAMGDLLSRRGDLAEALDEFRQNVALREGMAARHPHDSVRRRSLMIAYGHVAAVLGLPFVMNIGDFKGAREYLDKCVAIAREIVQADPQNRTGQFDLASALLRQAAVEVPRSGLAESLATFREAAGIMESLARADPRAVRYERSLAVIYEYTGYRLRDLGRTDEALVELRRSVAVSEAAMAAHPGDAPTLSQLIKDEESIANILLGRHDSAGALAHAQRGLSLALKYEDGPEAALRHRYVGDASFALAVIDRALKKTPEAREAAQRSIEKWNAPGVKNVNPKNREVAAAILADK